MTPEEAEAALSRLAFRNERLREKLSEVEEDRDGFREQAKWLKKDVAKLEEALKEAGATTTDVGSPEAEPLSAAEVELYRERLRRGRADASMTSVPRWLATIDALSDTDEGARLLEAVEAERERIAKGLVGMAEWLEGCVAVSAENGLPPQADQDGRAKGLREAAEYVTADWGIRARTEEADNDS
jgi:molecular chaperone GrpE (heat shock protein)